MLLMTADYARARDAKAERTMQWFVDNLRIKPFETPKITAIDVAIADAMRDEEDGSIDEAECCEAD